MMNSTIHDKTIIQSKIGRETAVTSFFDQLCFNENILQNDLTNDKNQLARIKYAISEACLNAIEHGNRNNPESFVTIEFFIDEKKQKLEILIQDSGTEVPKTIPTKEELEKKLVHKKGRKRGERGMGFFLIHSFVDDWNVESIYEGANPSKVIGTQVRLYIDLEKNKEKINE